MKPFARSADYQLAVLENPFEHFAMFGGIATGKTFTGSHWVIQRMFERPELTGLIGANNYDQLSQATLRELFYWLDQYEIPYVIDCRPPASWGLTRKVFKTYKNILSLQIVPGIITTVFTRVMSAPNPLRGTEFSWYWLDETRDTPKETFNVILSRLRESPDYRRGLITTTTNGEDWGFDNFITLGTYPLRGSIHVPTKESVRCGIISQSFYDMLLASYDTLFAQQELFALHVNIMGGRAYYSFGAHNQKPCPWGDIAPSPERGPLIVGADFNFDPAPMLWVVGQLGPAGSQWEDHLHWFDQVLGRQVSTRAQTQELISRYGTNFLYNVYGDASGGRGSTSNAGEHDFAQMAEEFDAAGCGFTIDFDPANPRVIDRVQNMNRLARAANGAVSMTYDKSRCTHLTQDARLVGWRRTLDGRGKLDDRGNKELTHAMDAAGYAAWKVLPFARHGFMAEAAPMSEARREITGLVAT